MRTTLTLEPEVAARVEQLMREHRQPLRVIVNAALREGLSVLERPARSGTPFKTKGFDLGPSLVGSVDDVEEVVAQIEGEAHR